MKDNRIIALFNQETGDYDSFFTPEGFFWTVASFILKRFDLSKMEIREFIIGEDTNLEKLEDFLTDEEWFYLHNYPEHMGISEERRKKYKEAFDKVWEHCMEVKEDLK